MKNLASDDEILEHLRLARPLIDVRAPIEFSQGSVPGSTNLPLLNDEERAQVGTCFKNHGEPAAVAIGATLVAGEKKEQRISAWSTFIKNHPQSAIQCLRGGLRSHLVQTALGERGQSAPLIEGGFKRVRTLLSEQLQETLVGSQWVVLSGLTGSGKTEVLRALFSHQSLDLEGAAHHRGSSFGSWKTPQPAPVTFENSLGLQALRLKESVYRDSFLILEDESRSIGKITLPAAVFATIQDSPVFILERPRRERADALIAEYLTENYGMSNSVIAEPLLSQRAQHEITAALMRLERRLGGLETQTIRAMLDSAFLEFATTGQFAAHTEWVDRLLAKYYDPMYEHHLARSNRTIAGRGDVEAFSQFLKLRPVPEHNLSR